jgi:hypothetical protein
MLLFDAGKETKLNLTILIHPPIEVDKVQSRRYRIHFTL